MPNLKIHNWDKWQSYRKDRGQPPWIKLHREVMRNPDWVTLTDGQRGQLVAIWLLAADSDGEIPASPDLVKKLCYMDSVPDLKLFIDKGFIEHDASVASTCRQDDAPETEAEAEKKDIRVKSVDLSPAPGFDDFWQVWPKKRDKKKTQAIWKRRKLDKIAEHLIADVRNRKKHDTQWQQGFIPNPTTYLNGDRWEDETTDGKPQAPRQASHKLWEPPDWMHKKH